MKYFLPGEMESVVYCLTAIFSSVLLQNWELWADSKVHRRCKLFHFNPVIKKIKAQTFFIFLEFFCFLFSVYNFILPD